MMVVNIVKKWGKAILFFDGWSKIIFRQDLRLCVSIAIAVENGIMECAHTNNLSIRMLQGGLIEKPKMFRCLMRWIDGKQKK